MAFGGRSAAQAGHEVMASSGEASTGSTVPASSIIPSPYSHASNSGAGRKPSAART